MTPKLILTGFMATGKSVVGPLLARRLGWRFIDTDALIVAREHRPIAAIFSEDGEQRFRALERQVVADLARERRRCPQCRGALPAVIATGGGVMVDEANCAALRRTGVVICLSARPDVIAARVARSRARRPKLMEGGKPLGERIRELMAERAVAYTRAHASVDTSDLPVDAVAERVLDAFVAEAKLRWKHSA
jgi:shikimate kinase